MITNLGNDVLIDFERDEFQLNGWAKFHRLAASGVPGINSQIDVNSQPPTFDIAMDGNDIVVTRVQGGIRIDRAQTWVVSGHETDDLLEHEQGHYYIIYISYVFALKAIRALRVPVAKTHIPIGVSAHQQQTIMHNTVILRIRPIFAQSQSRMTQLTSQYDTETNHGINRPEQQEWNRRFARSLVSGTEL